MPINITSKVPRESPAIAVPDMPRLVASVLPKGGTSVDVDAVVLFSGGLYDTGSASLVASTSAALGTAVVVGDGGGLLLASVTAAANVTDVVVVVVVGV